MDTSTHTALKKYSSSKRLRIYLIESDIIDINVIQSDIKDINVIESDKFLIWETGVEYSF